MIKNVILDFGGVLAYPISGNWFIPFDLFKIVRFTNLIKLMLKKGRLNNAFIAGNEYLNKNHQLSTEDEEYEQFVQFYKIVFDEMKIKVKDRVINKLANSKVYNDYQINIYDDVVNGIKELKEKYKVYIITDTWPSTKRILNNNGILQLLDGLTMSCNYNATKESTKLFEIAIEEFSLVPDECIFIDDSQSNLKNSEKAGFKPVLMSRRSEIDEAEYPIIHNMDGIRDVIEIMETESASS